MATIREAIEPRERAADFYGTIALDTIRDNRWNPRRGMNGAADEDLTNSIREHGVLEPLIVRVLEREDPTDPTYEVVAGARRLRCARAAGLTETACIVKDLTDAAALEIALVENVNRADMHPLDEAEAYAKLQRIDKRLYTIPAIAKRTGQTESHVYRRLRLLDLEAPLQNALADDRLSLGHAERLLRLPPALRKQAADPTSGVIWQRSPLLDPEDSWKPTRDDLRPLADLDQFLRTRSHFDPTSEDTKYFQPDLVAAIEEAVTNDAGGVDVYAESVDQARAEYLELSEDPRVTSTLKAAKSGRIPLAPSRWREVKKRCPNTQRGIVTHGGPPRVLAVCATPTCAVHFPPKRKPGRPPKDRTTPNPVDQLRQQQERERLEHEAWTKAEPAVRADLVAYLKGKAANIPSAELVRLAIGPVQSKHLTDSYGVKLTASTIWLFLALAGVGTPYGRDRFRVAVKPFGYDLAAFERRQKAEERARAKAAGKSTTREVIRRRRAVRKGARKR